MNSSVRKNTFFYFTMTIYIPFKYFPNQIEFDFLEFLLFLKSLNKRVIQYFTVEFSL